MDKNLLPIGSIVLLEDLEEKVMIIGHFSPVEKDNNTKVCDYCGCIYPNGVTTINDFFGFDSDKVKKVIHTGYKDEQEQEQEELINSVNNIYKEILFL